jgi:hypothetical protein
MILKECIIANSLTERCGHKTFQISGFWADYGQPAPYPSLAVRARNGRVADHPEVNVEMRVRPAGGAGSIVSLCPPEQSRRTLLAYGAGD